MYKLYTAHTLGRNPTSKRDTRGLPLPVSVHTSVIYIGVKLPGEKRVAVITISQPSVPHLAASLLRGTFNATVSLLLARGWHQLPSPGYVYFS